MKLARIGPARNNESMFHALTLLLSIGLTLACPYQCSGAGCVVVGEESLPARTCSCCPAHAAADQESDDSRSDVPEQESGCNCLCGGAVLDEQQDTPDLDEQTPVFDTAWAAANISAFAPSLHSVAGGPPLARVSGCQLRYLLQSLQI